MTVIELLITVVIIAVLVAVGGPAVLQAQRSLATNGAVDSAYFTFRQAKSHAVRGANDVVLDISAGSDWCIGITDQNTCDCAVANSCTVDGVSNVVTSQDFPGVTLSDVTFTDNQVEFDTIRGLPTTGAGSFNLSDGVREVRLDMNVLGRIDVCVVSGELRNYPSCGV